jgi:hypothetical protein
MTQSLNTLLRVQLGSSVDLKHFFLTSHSLWPYFTTVKFPDGSSGLSVLKTEFVVVCLSNQIGLHTSNYLNISIPI